MVCTMSQTGITQVTASRVCESRLSQEGFEKFYPPIDQWLPRWAFPRAARTASVRPTCEVHLTETASGWPLPALVSSQLWSLTPLGDFKTKFVRGGVSVDWADDWEMQWWFGLPLRPIWPQFLVDVMCFAAMWLAVLSGPTWLRRLIRLRRGHCPQCDFDLRGDAAPGCPECGWRRLPDVHRVGTADRTLDTAGQPSCSLYNPRIPCTTRMFLDARERHLDRHSSCRHRHRAQSGETPAFPQRCIAQTIRRAQECKVPVHDRARSHSEQRSRCAPTSADLKGC